jgi:NTE family protein
MAIRKPPPTEKASGRPAVRESGVSPSTPAPPQAQQPQPTIGPDLVLPSPSPSGQVVGFVLGGGGNLGDCEVGMLQALLERDIVPDLVVGTSVGAINGAAVAADPTPEAVERLRNVWLTLGEERVFSGAFEGAGNLIRKGTHLHSNDALRRMVERLLPVRTFPELAVPFQCVAASIERAAEQWFSDGPLVEAILASAAVPGLLPPVEIEGEHYVDGGIVNSIPVERAVELGATELWIMQVGRIERPLRPPRNLLQVATVSFEIARRHRFAREMAALPPGIVTHVLPTGSEGERPETVQIRYRSFSKAGRRIAQAYDAANEYLDRAARTVPRITQ